MPMRAARLKEESVLNGTATNGQQWLRLLLSDLVRGAVFPIYDRRQGLAFSRYLRQLRRFEFAPFQVIEQIQWERLHFVLRHALSNVPYYRELFTRQGIRIEEIRNAADFAKLPVLIKTELQQQAGALLAEKSQPREAKSNATGGSTGTPVQFYQDDSYWTWAKAAQRFTESWWGIRAGDRTAPIWGCDRDLATRTWRERCHHGIQQLRMCNAFALTQDKLEEFAVMLAAWKPRFVVGYASALEVFARFLLARPQIVVRPHAVKSTAEMLTAQQRETIQAAFNAPVYNFYGSREVNNLAAECPAHSGLHVNSLCRFVEIVDDQANPVGAGVPGRILVTDLTNFAMPFIRYETGDIAVWSEKSCGCGRAFPLLAEILGRKSDFIVAPSGKIIHGEFFTHLFYDIPEVANFQVSQASLSQLRVEIVLRQGATACNLSSLRQRIESALGAGVTCDIQIVHQLERTASGKHRFTMSSVPVQWNFDGDHRESVLRFEA